MGSAIVVKGITFSNWISEYESNLPSENEEVSAYLSISGVSSDYKDKLNSLVSGLKSAGIWDKIITLYPMLGSTFEQMSYNLKNVNIGKLTTVDNPILQITENVGFKRIGGGYISTGIGFDRLNDYHLLVNVLDFSADNEANLCVPIGVGATSDGSCMQLIYDDKLIFRNKPTNGIVSTDNISIGMLISSSSGIINNGEILSVESLGGNFDNTKNDIPIILGGFINSEVFHANKCPYKISGFGYNLTTSEMQKYSGLLSSFKG